MAPISRSVPQATAQLVYACGQWEIDLGRRELRSRGIPVPLGGRAFEIVTVLVQSAPELVTNSHMMDRVCREPPLARVRSTFTFRHFVRHSVQIGLCSRRLPVEVIVC